MKRFLTCVLAVGCVGVMAAVALAGVLETPPLGECQGAAKASQTRPSTCQAAGLTAAAGQKKSCQTQATTVALETPQSDTPQGCPVSSALDALLAMLDDMPAEHDARPHVIAAVKSLAKVDPQLEAKVVAFKENSGSACSSSKTSVLTVAADAPAKSDAAVCGSSKALTVASAQAPSTCGSQKAAVQVAANDASRCCSASKTAKALTVASAQAPSTCGSQKAAVQVAANDANGCCSASKASKASMVAAAGSPAGATCGSNAVEAKYVAFGCCKSDRLARAAAEAYLQVIRELKDVSGAEGCPSQAATKVLAAVLGDRRAEGSTAQTDAVVPQAVSLSTVGNVACAPDCTEVCCVVACSASSGKAAKVTVSSAKVCGPDCAKSCCTGEK